MLGGTIGFVGTGNGAMAWFFMVRAYVGGMTGFVGMEKGRTT